MKTFSFYWTEKLGKAILKASSEPYPVEFHLGSQDHKAIEAAVNQGIDSHLEAIFFQQGKGNCGRIRLVINPESIPVLVRRLMESEEEDAQQLASAICGTLGIELI